MCDTVNDSLHVIPYLSKRGAKSNRRGNTKDGDRDSRTGSGGACRLEPVESSFVCLVYSHIHSELKHVY